MMRQWMANYCYQNGYQKQEPTIDRSSTNKSRSSSKSLKALEAANLKKGLEKKIEDDNIGYEMLLKMGYQVGRGLGKNCNGILKPLPLENKTDRLGLGACKTAVAAAPVKTNKQHETPKLPRSRTRRRQSNAEKAAKEVGQQAKLASDQANVAKKAAHKARELAIKAEKHVNQLKVESKAVTYTASKPRKHSPIRAPTSGPQEYPAASILSDSKYLKTLLDRFYSEIELMQLRLEAAATVNPELNDNDFVIAKIRVLNNEIIDEHAFDFIRTELVGWIGMYQEQNMDTPIYHAMTNNHRHITVVCDNEYAFQCLEHCVKDIVKIKTMKGIRVWRLPPITPLIYCFDAIYEGVARDPELFLRQIKLHRSKLRTNTWVVASHKVCRHEHKTYMTFLIDERSALALNFQYSSNFCICMQAVIFRNRGIVTDNYLN